MDHLINIQYFMCVINHVFCMQLTSPVIHVDPWKSNEDAIVCVGKHYHCLYAFLTAA